MTFTSISTLPASTRVPTSLWGEQLGQIYQGENKGTNTLKVQSTSPYNSTSHWQKFNTQHTGEWKQVLLVACSRHAGNQSQMIIKMIQTPDLCSRCTFTLTFYLKLSTN